MKRKHAVTIALLFALCSAAFGQAPKAKLTAHSVALSWGAGTSGALYKVYRASCNQAIANPVAGTNGSQIGTCPSPGQYSAISSTTSLNYTDASVASATLYSYQVTASCGVVLANCPANVSPGESAPTANVGVLTPFDLVPVTPPSNLTITTLAVNHTSGSKDQVVASWRDTPNAPTSFALFGASSVLKQGTSKSSSGRYTVSWSGARQNGYFTVCDYLGACVSQFFAE